MVLLTGKNYKQLKQAIGTGNTKKYISGIKDAYYSVEKFNSQTYLLLVITWNIFEWPSYQKCLS